MEVYGRESELARLLAHKPRVSGQGRLVLVRGPDGVGKTALLRVAMSRWQQRDVLVLEPKWEGRVDDSSPQVLNALQGAVRDHFEELNDPGVGRALATSARLSSLEDPSPVMLRSAARSLFRQCGANHAVALVVDPPPGFAAFGLLEAARREGCLAVVSTRKSDADTEDHLAMLADVVIDLEDLPEHYIDQIVAKAAGGPVDGRLLAALRASLGSLAGNPGTVLGAFAGLREAGRLTTVIGHVCLVRPGQVVPLHPDHPLLVFARRLGPLAERILTLIAAMGPLDLAGLATLPNAVLGEPESFGRTIDELVAAGLLTVNKAGQIVPICPALGESAVDGLGSDVSRTVYEELVDAGQETSRRHPGVTEATRGESESAVRALRELPVNGTRFVSALTDLLGTVVQEGRYDLLGRLVEEFSGAVGGAPALHADLASAALLSALHTGRPTSATVADHVYRGVGGAGAAAFEQWWFGDAVHYKCPPPIIGKVNGPFAGGTLFTFGEIDLVAYALSGDYDRCQAALAELRPGRTVAISDVTQLIDDGLRGDLLATFRFVLKSRYGTPLDGPLAAYHQIARDYLLGRWPEALSTCRELELGAHVATQLHHRAKFLAAEMSGMLGDLKQSHAWLAAASSAEGFTAMRTWAHHWHAVAEGGLDKSLEGVLETLSACLRADGRLSDRSRVGLGQLISRGVECAVELGLHNTAIELLGRLERLQREQALPNAEVLVLFAQAFVHGNLLCARACAELARAREHPLWQAKACLAAGRLASDPTPWLHEAYRVSKGLHVRSMRTRVLRAMRAAGVTVPRNRAERARFSDTELRIIDLVREGWTNRQIASDIQVTEKTVESYLTKLFAKTGCRSRVELATGGVTGGLPVPAST